MGTYWKPTWKLLETCIINIYIGFPTVFTGLIYTGFQLVEINYRLLPVRV
jgi:hypothetical protein